MARRPATPKPKPEYLYPTLEACEDPENATLGLHKATVPVWPPPRSRSGEVNPALRARCERCGCHLLLYADNDPAVSGIEVVLIERGVREVAGKK